MLENQKIRPAQVIGPLGEPLTIDSLPAPCTTRWVVRRKAEVVAAVDGGPKIITFVVDGILNDGGDRRQFGWGRFSPTLREANGSPTLRISPGAVQAFRIYSRALRTSEAVGNWRAGASG